MRVRRSVVLWGFGLVFAAASISYAKGTPTITEISILLEGHEPPPGSKFHKHNGTTHTALNVDQVRKVLPLKEGDFYAPQQVDKAVAYLKKWGRFTEVSVDRLPEKGGMRLVFRLKDGDIISGIDIYKTYPYLSTRIRRSVTVHSGDLYDHQQTQEQTQKIAAFYERQGYSDTQVDFHPRFDEDKHTVDLKYQIQKGNRYRIGKITVIGNTVFPQSYFVSQINPLLSYKPSRFRKSLENIRLHYVGKGFIGARVRLKDLGRDDAGRVVHPTLDIKEGKHVAVHYSGNARVSQKTFKKILPLYTDGGYGSYEIEASERSIVYHYRQLGFQEVNVTSRLEKPSENSLEIFFSIHEGPQTRVKSIEIVGNEEISDRKLKKHLYTKENGISERGYYQPRTVGEDFARIPSIMKDQGALDAEALRHETTLNDFHDKAHVVFEVREGDLVRIQDILVEGAPHFSSKEILSHLSLGTKDPLSQSHIDNDKDALTIFYANNGFPYAEITPEVKRDGSRATLIYHIQSGPLVRIGEVLYVGNERTDPKSLKRAMRIRAGQTFSYKKILESEAALRRAGPFRSANIQTIGLTEKDPVVHLVVKLEEYRKVVVDVGATFDTDNSFTGDLLITHLNLGGTIRRANLRLTGGRDIQKGDLIFKDPFFFGYPFEFTTDFFLERDLKPGFKIVEGGGSISLLREFTPRTSLLGRYSLIRTFFTDVTDATGLDEENHTTSKFSFSLNYDRRNSFADPHKGFLGFAGFDISNKIIASTFNFIQPKGYMAYYVPLGDRLTFISYLRAEGIKVFGADQITRDQKLFLGGDYSIRGFNEDGVGPFGADGRPAGGQLLMMASFELQARLFSSFKFAAFTDMGSLTNNFSDVSWSSLRNSAGAGIRYVTPVGQLRLDYALKLDKRAGESPGRLHFAFGYAF